MSTQGITYELAKELRDAGFSFEEIKGGMCVRRPEDYIDFNPTGDEAIGSQHYYKPTLSELIAACQKKGTEKYPRNIKITISGQTSWWTMISTEEDKNLVPVCSGSTPEETVAKLWLALNKKKV